MKKGPEDCIEQSSGPFLLCSYCVFCMYQKRPKAAQRETLKTKKNHIRLPFLAI